MIYLTVIILLFLFAIFDLYVGVSNDAVNFLNSAVGSKVATYRTILIIASFGVFAGAVMSNGMMDVARHGVFHPQYFTYNELVCIMLAVMTTDVMLLDIFNTRGLPTSTTISLVFELLGGTVVMALFKTSADSSLQFGELLNTSQALKMILVIFFSVAVAFIMGTVVQYLSRLAFTFNYKKRLKYLAGLFGGIAVTAIFYFMLIKNIKGSSLMNAESSAWITENSTLIMLICFIVSVVLMQILYWLKVNVLKIIVLLGTFALAMAFASNDLVNFIGVPLAGLSAYLDFSANAHGASGDNFLMSSLMNSARTPILFLVAAGAMMIYALTTSKKAQRVVKTSVDLSRQDEGNETFGASIIARTLVRTSQNTSKAICQCIPNKTLKWMDRQFRKDDREIPRGAAFDLVRASINLVISALLIAWGTSYKLPLSTTYVTFMVAMGSSLADRAWGRESAVFRVTGVLSVIGGWFVTAGVAFVACFCITSVMHLGGLPAMIIFSVIAVVSLVRSHIRFNKKQFSQTPEDVIFNKYMTSKDKDETWTLLRKHVAIIVDKELDDLHDVFLKMTTAFEKENLRDERRIYDKTEEMKEDFKRARRCGLLGLRRLNAPQAVMKGTYFHLLCNNLEGMIYGMRRLSEVLKEHLEKNFNPMPKEFFEEFLPLHDEWSEFLKSTQEFLKSGRLDEYHKQFGFIDAFRGEISVLINRHIERVQNVENTNKLNAYIVYLSILQETQAEAAMLKQVVRNYAKFVEN